MPVTLKVCLKKKVNVAGIVVPCRCLVVAGRARLVLRDLAPRVRCVR